MSTSPPVWQGTENPYRRARENDVPDRRQCRPGSPGMTRTYRHRGLTQELCRVIRPADSPNLCNHGRCPVTWLQPTVQLLHVAYRLPSVRAYLATVFDC